MSRTGSSFTTSRGGDERRRRVRRRAVGATIAALAVGALVPAAASANWTEPQTVCTNCSEGDGIVSYAEAPNGAAVAAWNGDRKALAAYRGPNDDEFGTPFTVATGGKPSYVRAAINSTGTAAVMSSAGTQSVVARRGPSDSSWSTASSPGEWPAVAPDGSVLVLGWVAPLNGSQSAQIFTWPANGTAFGGGTTLGTLAAPFTFQEGIYLSSNGQGDYVATWNAQTGTQSTDQAFASYSSDGTTWTAPEAVGTGSAVETTAVDPMGNALAFYGNPGTPVYRWYTNTSWGSPESIPFGSYPARNGELAPLPSAGFDLVGNAAALGQTPNGAGWGYAVRRYTDGTWTTKTLPSSGTWKLGVGQSGDTILVRSNGSSLTSQWGSSINPNGFKNQDDLPGSGVRSLIGVGLDMNSNATAVYSTAPSGSRLGSVFATTRRPGAGGEIQLTAGQLETNQKISQAAVLRSNGALSALEGGLPASAFRGAAFGAPAFGSSVPITGTAGPSTPSNAPGYQVPVPSKTGGGGTVTLSAAQLETNQKISQAAVLRSNAVRDRLAAGLTAAQIGAGAISSASLLPGLGFGALGAGSPGTPITVPTGGGSGGTVTLSQQQLETNQAISQAAVRRSNLNIALLEAGLTQDGIAAGGISSQNVSP